MIKGIDTATPVSASVAASLAADNYSFVCRYLVPTGGKRLTKDEADTISDNGLQIISVFETTADRALGGRAAGLADGAKAAQTAQNVGQPKGSCIYAAVDFEATKAQMPTVLAYIQAFSEATPDYTTGVYGSYDVIEAAYDARVCSRFWQTRAWSRGKESAAANLYQYDCGPTGLGLSLHGIDVDLNYAYGNEGSWNTRKPIEEAKPKMKVEDANKIIQFLKAGFGVVESHSEAREEFRRLANALREASGQPQE